MLLLRHHGLDIPDYPRGTEVAWTRKAIKEAARLAMAEQDAGTGDGTFLRRAVLEYPSKGRDGTSLKAALELARTVISEAIRRISSDDLPVSAVPYQFGLLRGRPPRKLEFEYQSGRHPLVPRGFCLVMRVAALPASAIPAGDMPGMHSENTACLGYGQETIVSRLNERVARITALQAVRIRDMTYRQFSVVGPEAILHDTEPRVEFAHIRYAPPAS